MGKPFIIELQNIETTYKLALESSVDELSKFIDNSINLPLIAIGSGGALTAAHLTSLLHQNSGMISKALTPLEFLLTGNLKKDFSILFITASGHNTDILSAFKFAINREFKNIMSLCMKDGSPLERLSKQYNYTNFISYDLKFGKDGFLATNSLLSFMVIIIKAYKKIFQQAFNLPIDIPYFDRNHYKDLNSNIRSLLNKKTWVILYGGWGEPIAIDAESKFTEAALKNIQLADYRNFGHGRHNWISKRGNDTGIVALITPSEIEIAKKTIALLPKEISLIKIETDFIGPAACIDLFIKLLNLVYLVGISEEVDPGKPTIPIFGRKIYHLNLLSSNILKNKLKLKNREEISILRKCNCPSLDDLNYENLEFWKQAYKSFIKKIEGTKFGVIIFDYDGTLCDLKNRFDGISEEIKNELIDLLKSKIIIGIATGRGKSVKFEFQRKIPKEYWESLIIGYYNCSEIASLRDNFYPKKTKICNPELEEIKNILEKNKELYLISKTEFRTNQITLEPNNSFLIERVKDIVFDTITKFKNIGVQALESSHSIDIIAPKVSKLDILKVCEEKAKELNVQINSLVIGDKGRWPGNDYELLSSPYSLSVDTVSPNIETCWNISNPGIKGTQATLAYLKYLNISKGYFKFKIS